MSSCKTFETILGKQKIASFIKERVWKTMTGRKVMTVVKYRSGMSVSNPKQGVDSKAKPPESGDLYDVIRVWSGVGTPKAYTKGQSRRCSYATPHEVVTSYKLPDKGCFAFISHCFKYQVDTKLFISSIVNVLWTQLHQIMSGA